MNFIYDFQIKLHQLFSNDKEIRLTVDRIYLSIVQDAKYPFLLINILKIENMSKFNNPIYDIEFEICAFARDKNQGILVSLADKITNKLNSKTYILKDYIIAGMRAGNITFKPSIDLITTKLSVNYKALIKKDI